MIAQQTNQTTHDKELARRKRQEAYDETMSLAEPDEPAAVVRRVLTVPWVTVTRMVGRLFPRHSDGQFPVTRTFREDTNRDGTFDTELVVKAVKCPGCVVAVVTLIRVLPDPTLPADREPWDVPDDVIERAKLLMLAGC